MLYLSLSVVTGDDVANGAECRCYHSGFVTREKCDESRHNASVDHTLNLLVRAVRQVGQRPARVREHLPTNHKNRIVNNQFQLFTAEKKM